MCLYPKYIKNPKYLPNIKNGGNPPKLKDKRVALIPVGCQKCMECTKQRANGWRTRLLEEIKQHKPNQIHFITLTFSNESITELSREIPEHEKGYERDNAIATLGMRRFLERWRAKYGTSIRHWFITELGHNGTENIHLHGIMIVPQHTTTIHGKKYDTTQQEIAKVWKYGYVWKGSYVNETTVNYVIKYCTKMDATHLYYKPKVLSSKGIGRNYINSVNAKLTKYKPNNQTREHYITRQGFKIGMPTYYRNHLYTEEEREKLWIEKLEKKERWVDGSRVSIAYGDQTYYKVLQQARLKNQRLGYGNDEKDWDRQQYEQQRRDYLHAERTRKHRQDDIPTTGLPQMDRGADRPTNNAAERATKWLRQMAQRQRSKIQN